MALFHRIKILEQADAIGAAVLDQLCDLDEVGSRLSIVSLKAAHGSYRGFETYLCSEIHSPSVLMVMLRLANPEPQKLLLYAEGFLSKLGKKLFKSQDLQIGDEKLDALVMVKSSAPESTLRLLQKPATIEALLSLYERYPDSVTNDVSLRLKLADPTPGDLRDALDRLCQVAESLGDHD